MENVSQGVATVTRECAIRALALWPPVVIVLALLTMVGLLGEAAAQSRDIAFAQAATLFPEATSVGPLEGTPPAAMVFRGTERIGYVFHSFDTVGSTGFSGRPIDVLIGIDLVPRIVGARLVEHHEPILAIGIDEARIARFLDQYRGRDLRARILLAHSRQAASSDGLDAISGASISSIVLHDAILRAARDVALGRGLLASAASTGAGSLDLERFDALGWSELVRDGSITRLKLSVGDVRRALPGAQFAAPDTATFIDLYLALATPARIGRNLLGDNRYAQAMAGLGEGESMIVIAAAGLYSFKGTGFARSGVFDRVAIVQGQETLRLRSEAYLRLDALQAKGVPDLTEMGLFRLPPALVPWKPWRLELLVESPGGRAGADVARFSLDYELPPLYRTAPPAAAAGGVATGAGAAEALWRSVWQEETARISILVAALLGLLLILLFQDGLVRRSRVYTWVRLAYLCFTLAWLGYAASVQLSVLNVLTFLQALLTGFRWELFLLDPLVFLLWGFVAVALLFWGRGVFCGWLCPFGALQELTARLARHLGLTQWRVPFLLHERLWPIKYVIFLALAGATLQSIDLIQPWTEVEPFKTAISLKFARPALYVVYAVGLIAVSAVIERAFCRYLCPLGGALAIPARLRMFDWLKRRKQCGAECQICAQRCPVQAIHPSGQINPNECIDCLGCQVLFYDEYGCPPLIARRKRREARINRRTDGATAETGMQP